MKTGYGFPRREMDKNRTSLIYNEIQNVTLRFSTEFYKYRVAGVNVVHIAVLYIL